MQSLDFSHAGGSAIQFPPALQTHRWLADLIGTPNRPPHNALFATPSGLCKRVCPHEFYEILSSCQSQDNGYYRLRSFGCSMLEPRCPWRLRLDNSLLLSLIFGLVCLSPAKPVQWPSQSLRFLSFDSVQISENETLCSKPVRFSRLKPYFGPSGPNRRDARSPLDLSRRT
jgi:hypothetical protein